jgi:hypothetical protein
MKNNFARAPHAGFEIKFKYFEKYFLENKMHYDHCLVCSTDARMERVML